MARASKGNTPVPQVNFTLDAHWRLVLRLVAEADSVTVPDLLRPVVLRYLRGRLRDKDLAEAVARIEKVQDAKRRIPDNLAILPKNAAKTSPAPTQRRRQSRPS